MTDARNRAVGHRVLSRRARFTLAVLWIRRRLSRGDPYRRRPRSARLAGVRVRTYNLDTLSYLVREIFVDGCYEVGDLPPGARIVDVGANIGLAALYFRRRYPDAHIHAVEADPDAVALLRHNLATGGQHRVSIDHVAACDTAGPVTLYRRAGKPGRLTASLSSEYGGESASLVPGIRLSTLVTGPVDLVKLDIEGAEHAVIAELAAAGALRRVRRLVFELHAPAAHPEQADRTLNLLRSHGFTCVAASTGGTGWQAVAEDLIVRATRDPGAE